MSTEDAGLEREFTEYASIAQIADELGVSMGIVHRLSELAGLAESSGSDAKGLIKLVNDLRDSQKHADLMRSASRLELETAQIESKLAEAIRDATALEKENAELKERIQRLEDNQLSNLVLYENGLYYMPGDDKHAFCPSCLLGSNRRRSLLSRTHYTHDKFTYSCKDCGWSERRTEPNSSDVVIPKYNSRAYW